MFLESYRWRRMVGLSLNRTYKAVDCKTCSVKSSTLVPFICHAVKRQNPIKLICAFNCYLHHLFQVGISNTPRNKTSISLCFQPTKVQLQTILPVFIYQTGLLGLAVGACNCSKNSTSHICQNSAPRAILKRAALATR